MAVPVYRIIIVSVIAGFSLSLSLVFENLIKFRSPDQPRGEIVSCEGKHRVCIKYSSQGKKGKRARRGIHLWPDSATEPWFTVLRSDKMFLPRLSRPIQNSRKTRQFKLTLSPTIVSFVEIIHHSFLPFQIFLEFSFESPLLLVEIRRWKKQNKIKPPPGKELWKFEPNPIPDERDVNYRLVDERLAVSFAQGNKVETV